MKEILKKIWGYLTFKRQTENEDNTNIKLMHGINKLSLAMFLVAMIVLIVKCSQ
jgi:hypothetical protein